MQSENQRRLEPVPDAVAKALVTVKTHAQAKEVLRACPRPTLYVGETVEVKGMSFVVTRLKADGRVGLRMVPSPR